MVEDLVYDVGANNGDDSAHYLQRGFRVVAVEANPEYCDLLENRFADEIESAHLTVVRSAVGPTQGCVPFFVSEGNRGVWSSLDREEAMKDDVPIHKIEVPCVRLASIFREYGVPYYLKVDIEGADHYCIADIDPEDPPRYVSFEAAEGRLCDLFTLYSKGYRGFKLIDQAGGFGKMTAPSLHSVGHANKVYRAALRRHLKRVPVLGPAVRSLRAGVSRFRSGRNDPPSERPRWSVGELAVSSSGPMPDVGPGAWDDVEETAYIWHYHVNGRTLSRWYDVHAVLRPGG